MTGTKHNASAESIRESVAQHHVAKALAAYRKATDLERRGQIDRAELFYDTYTYHIQFADRLRNGSVVVSGSGANPQGGTYARRK